MVVSLYTPFFFNDTATTEIYTLSLHDALPICVCLHEIRNERHAARLDVRARQPALRAGSELVDRFLVPAQAKPEQPEDRKSTRLNSSHVEISYAVFCLKKKKKKKITIITKIKS